MDFLRNLPFFCIMLAMFTGIVSSAVNGRIARRLCLFMVTAVLVMSALTLYYVDGLGESITYMMGHFPAPWGNEIRFGSLEAFLALYFSVIMLLSVLGGWSHAAADIEVGKENLFYVLIDLMMASLLAMIYTNDLFTGYVFVEINTIAACGMIMIRQNGHGIVAAIRYMVMSLIGSGLFLIGISLLYDVTGHLLMVSAHTAVEGVVADGKYVTPLLVIIALISVGMAIKSGLYPFHSWIPETYGYATPTASAILSSLVSKGYIILLIKIFYRVIGFDIVVSSHVLNALFAFGVIAMIMGSVHAILQTDCRKMIAYSSVAQIGYIYMGIGLGTKAGMIAAVFHLLTHAATKSLLFISAVGLYEVSDGRTDYLGLRNAGYRNRIAGLAFSVGALSMVGFPMLSGFISKYLFATAALERPHKMIITLIALIISTILNAIYFLRQVVTIYSGRPGEAVSTARFIREAIAESTVSNRFASLALILLNLFLGLFSEVVIALISRGLDMFA
ncbi:multicomponent Na+:H+ antiporter subunit D [Lachnospiraceae bacterium XBB2008]|nr:multicomponent Na+:H+ antiporter subunit D [Lachnospiraceae bacterium XBB2008]